VPRQRPQRQPPGRVEAEQGHVARLHPDQAPRHHLHARQPHLGPAPDDDLQIDHRRPAQDVQQAGRVLLAAVQQQQAGVQRFRRLVEASAGDAAEEPRVRGAARQRDGREAPPTLAEGHGAGRRLAVEHDGRAAAAVRNDTRGDDGVARQQHLTGVLPRHQLQEQVVGVVQSEGAVDHVQHRRTGDSVGDRSVGFDLPVLRITIICRKRARSRRPRGANADLQSGPEHLQDPLVDGDGV
jgi:hypothetical protein